MPDQVALQRGRDWEERVSVISGGHLVPGSGNKWSSRGDVQAVFLIQAKAERGRSWSQTRRELKDAIDDSIGTGRPAALALLDDDGEELFVARLSDVIGVLSSGAQPLSGGESRGEERRRMADTPKILQGVEDGSTLSLRGQR
jgi:hypothetical protein